MAGVFDEIEYKHGFRCDGVATSVINSMNTIAVGLSIGIFNLLIRGYIQPEFDAAGNCITTQPDNIISAIVWAFVGINIFIHAGLAILLRFLDIELKLPAIQKIIRQRQIDKCKANGEEWVEPAEKARLLQEVNPIHVRPKHKKHPGNIADRPGRCAVPAETRVLH